jgi:hypothetical protein
MVARPLLRRDAFVMARELGLAWTTSPQTYYLTDYYEPHPVILVRAARIDREALRDLLAMARRATVRKADRRRGPRPLDERP